MTARSTSLESSFLHNGLSVKGLIKGEDVVEPEAMGVSLGSCDTQFPNPNYSPKDSNPKHSSQPNQSLQPLTQSHPITPSKSTRTISLNTNHLPPTPDPTPDPTPSKALKRNYDTSCLSAIDDRSPLTSKRQRVSPADMSGYQTPSPTPTKRPAQSSLPTPTPKIATPTPEIARKSLFKNVPEWSIVHPKNSAQERKGRPDVSPHELKRAAESILEQVDWREVAAYVASNRSGRTYEKILKGLLQEKIDELVEARGEGRNDLYEIGAKEMDYRADVEP